MRALVRLVYPGRSDVVRVENEWYGDMSMLFSDFRDAQITFEVFNQIIGGVADLAVSPIFGDFLVSRCRVVQEKDGGVDECLMKLKEGFISGRERVLKTPIGEVCGVFLQEGFFRAYRRV